MRIHECEHLLKLLDQYGREIGLPAECESLAARIYKQVQWLRLPQAAVVGPVEPVLTVPDPEHPPRPFRVQLQFADGSRRYWTDSDAWPQEFATEGEAREKVIFRVQQGMWRL